MSRKSALVVALGDYRAQHRPLYFTRRELNQLLSLYSRHVARGIWRDYAIDNREGMAVFSVFRHAQEGPAYSIVKATATSSRPAEFVVMTGRQRLHAAASLAAALGFFRTPLSIVAAD